MSTASRGPLQTLSLEKQSRRDPGARLWQKPHGSQPHIYAWHRQGIGAAAAGICQAPHRSHSGLCPPSQRSPQAALVMSALGRERETGSGGCFPDAPRAWREKGLALCSGSRSFHRTVTATTSSSPQTSRLLFHFIFIKIKKTASTHRAIHYSNKIMPRAVWEELLRILSLNHPNPQN